MATTQIVLVTVLLFSAPQLAMAQRQWSGEDCPDLTSGPEPPKLVIDDVELDQSSSVPNELWQRVASSVRQTDLDVGPDTIEGIRVAGILGKLRDEGYYRAKADVNSRVVSGSSTEQHVVVSVYVDAGSQYTIAGVGFGAKDSGELLSFSEQELRKLVLLEDGELFSSAKLRQSLEALRKFYAARGYVDFTSEPVFDVDDADCRMTVVFKLDEGRQYHVGEITVLGLNHALEGELRSKLRYGDVVNLQIIEDFYDDHKSELPEAYLTQISGDMRQAIAHVHLDFRPPPCSLQAKAEYAKPK